MHRWIQPVAVVVCLSLLGCDAAPTAAPPTAASKANSVAARSAASGVVETADGRYTFAPTTCLIHREGDAFDIEIGGPGNAPDGEKIHVEFSSTANELSIDLGVDRPFASSERTLKAGAFVSKEMQLDVSGQTVRVAELELVDTQGKRQSGSLEINC